MKLDAVMNNLWYKGKARPLFYALLMPTLVFEALVYLRTWFYRFLYPHRHFPVPIIVIGNLTPGGTGKTPFTLALIQLLQEKGYALGVVARGYKSKAEFAKNPLLVNDTHTAADVGDEVYMLYHKTKVPCAVNRKRVAAVVTLLKAHPHLDLILSDDGLQHLKLKRDMEIVIIDGKRHFGNGAMLPAGPLREPVSRLDSVDFVLTSGVDFKIELKGCRPLKNIRPSEAEDTAIASYAGKRPSMSEQAPCPLPLTGTPLHAVAAIGHPERFFESLKSLGYPIIPHIFPDHHPFSLSDFAGFETEPIIMTEKDAVKCQNFPLTNASYLQIKAVLSPVFQDEFLKKVRYIAAKKEAS